MFSDELAKKYGVNASGEGFTKEMAMAEAERAVAPFKIEWETCDWFVLYVSSLSVCGALRYLEILIRGRNRVSGRGSRRRSLRRIGSSLLGTHVIHIRLDRRRG